MMIPSSTVVSTTLILATPSSAICLTTALKAARRRGPPRALVGIEGVLDQNLVADVPSFSASFTLSSSIS
jgi:hypothetical protein